jgi:ferredoxin
MESDEEDRLTRPGADAALRLGCQAVVEGDVIVELVE